MLDSSNYFHCSSSRLSPLYDLFFTAYMLYVFQFICTTPPWVSFLCLLVTSLTLLFLLFSTQGLSAALLGVMGSRFKKSGKVFPAGVVSLISLVMTGGYLHGIMRSLH